jgi:hypothetical protein
MRQADRVPPQGVAQRRRRMLLTLPAGQFAWPNNPRTAEQAVERRCGPVLGKGQLQQLLHAAPGLRSRSGPTPPARRDRPAPEAQRKWLTAFLIHQSEDVITDAFHRQRPATQLTTTAGWCMSTAPANSTSEGRRTVDRGISPHMLFASCTWRSAAAGPTRPDRLLSLNGGGRVARTVVGGSHPP